MINERHIYTNVVFYLVGSSTDCPGIIPSEHKSNKNQQLEANFHCWFLSLRSFTSHLQEKNENAFLIDGKFLRYLPQPLLGIVVYQTKL